MIHLSQIKKTYRQGSSLITVLQGVDLNVAEGEKLAIVGPSGGGKSTLLSILSGVEVPDTGVMQVRGVDTSKFSPDDWADFRAEHYGIVFQEFHLIEHLTALENVMIPQEMQGIYDTTYALECLNSVGLQERAKHKPSELSGGEAQRVAMARAIVNKPSIILADEPSGNLDLTTGEHVMDLLFNLVNSTGATLVLVTHNMDLARRCDRVMGIAGGLLQQIA